MVPLFTLGFLLGLTMGTIGTQLEQDLTPRAPGGTERGDSRILRGVAHPREVKLHAKRYFLTWSQIGDHTLDELQEQLQRFECDYKIMCLEDHHETDGKHFHALLLLKRSLNTRDMRYFDLWGLHPNIQTCKKQIDVDNRIAYIKKDGNWREEGETRNQRRNNLRKEKLQFIETSTLRQCIDSGMFGLSEIRNIPTIKFYMLPKWPIWKKREVRWFYGETGSGKTRTAIEDLAQTYVTDYCILSGDLKNFFTGYEGQRGVLFDDLRPGSIKFETLLRVLDGYPVTVNVKGAHCEWLAEKIYITAPTAPSEMYVYKTETGETRNWDHLDQLKRRIDQELEFPLDDTQEL